MVVAYAVLVPMKWQDVLPARMTWSRVVLGPAILALTVPFFLSVPPRRAWFWLLIWLLPCFALAFFDSAPTNH